MAVEDNQSSVDVDDSLSNSHTFSINQVVNLQPSTDP